MSAPKLTEAQREMLEDATRGPIIINAFGRPLADGLDLQRRGLLGWCFGGQEPYTMFLTDAGRAALRGES